MTAKTSRPSFVSRLCAFARAENGMAAVEFAAVLPFMLTAYLGGIELGDGVAISRKVAITTHAVTDLATRSPTINNAEMATILGASAQIISPYDPGQLAVTVSGVKVDGNGNATIDWSNTLNGSAHAVGSPITLPNGLATPNSYYVLGEVKYNYTPTLGYVLTGTLGFSNQIFMSPRESASITRVNS